MSDIRVSEKHGVNPALGVCYWCGEEDGTVILAGRLPDDREAPRHMMHGYEPCSSCKENRAKGITLIEVDKLPAFERQPPIQTQREEKIYPTGRWWVVREQAAVGLFGEDVLHSRAAFIEVGVATKIGLEVTDVRTAGSACANQP